MTWHVKPWVVGHRTNGQIKHFDTRDDALRWVDNQKPSWVATATWRSNYVILSASEVRAIEKAGATIFDEFGQDIVWR